MLNMLSTMLNMFPNMNSDSTSAKHISNSDNKASKTEKDRQHLSPKAELFPSYANLSLADQQADADPPGSSERPSLFPQPAMRAELRPWVGGGGGGRHLSEPEAAGNPPGGEREEGTF